LRKLVQTGLVSLFIFIVFVWLAVQWIGLLVLGPLHAFGLISLDDKRDGPFIIFAGLLVVIAIMVRIKLQDRSRFREKLAKLGLTEAEYRDVQRRTRELLDGE
jgi:hypothetical protein